MSAKLAFRIIQIQSEYYFFAMICWVILSGIPSILIFLINEKISIPILFAFLISFLGLFELPIKNLSKIGEIDRDLKINFKPIFIALPIVGIAFLFSLITIQIAFCIVGIFLATLLVEKTNKKTLLMEIIIYTSALILAPVTLLFSIPFAISFIINFRKIENLSNDEKSKLQLYVTKKIN